MIKNLISQKITRRLGHMPTSSQKILIGHLSEFVTQAGSDSLFIIKGYAGTGKTSAISALVKTMEEFRLKFILLAPTGRAAKILSQYSGRPAFTIHKKIYRQKSSKDGFGRFVLEKNLHTNTIFIVDEASMISNIPGDTSVFGSGYLLDDLLQYVYNDKGCKLIISGDTAQLPPVGSANSPALDKAFYGGIFTKIIECELTEVVRQEQKSGILENATFLRELIKKGMSGYPRFNIKGCKDMVRVPGNELIDYINKSYETDGIEQTVVINRSNKRSNMYNSGIRSRILFREDELIPGDILMVVKNNYYWLQDNEQIDFIANGDAIEIIKIKKYREIYGFRFADVKLRLIDYGLETDAKIMLDTLHVESASLTSEQNKNLFYTIYEDYEEIKPKRKGYNMVRDNPYFNALQVKFAYAVTCHKAQGGQWKNVFIDQGFINENRMDTEYLRWLYTAITRSTQNLYLINFPEKYFE
ncbi:MAG: AAA family ATPase [Bacteroidales bacterium]|nr:AAA family ATPase [Bacteroidales bacterium]